MKRRLACIVLAALLLLGLCCTAFAEAPAATEAQLWNITDTVGLLTSDEDLTLEARAEEISAQYGVGIYLLILEDYSEYYDDPYETAYELYHQNTLGMGEDRDGVILLMSMSDRKYATFFYGRQVQAARDVGIGVRALADGLHLAPQDQADNHCDDCGDAQADENRRPDAADAGAARRRIVSPDGVARLRSFQILGADLEIV